MSKQPHTVRMVGLHGWYDAKVVGYIAPNGDLACTECYLNWDAEKRQTCNFVYEDSKPHCDEPCDFCGE